MARSLEKLLNLQPGDLRRGSLLFLYLFLIMSSYMVARVARDALFLEQFKAVELPYVDIAISLLIGFVIAAYIRAGRLVSVRTLLIGTLATFAVTAAVFWWLAHYSQPKWLFPVLYVWVGIFGVLAVSQVWTLANYVLTSRQAKRVFGVVGSGAILGGTFGGKIANFFAPRYGTESLLLGMAGAVVVCIFLVVLIWRQRIALLPEASAEREEAAVGEESPQNLKESIRLVASSEYLFSIATLILIANITTSLAGWQFKALSKQFYPATDQLAAFFGAFYFYAGLAAFGVQLLLTSRVLRRFGLGVALFVVPSALALGSLAVLISGALWAAIALRCGINVLQYSIDKSTVELLYLPMAASVKVQVKSFIDSVIWRMGDGFAGILVLLFGKYFLELTAREMSVVALVLIAGWMGAALVARRRYVGTLRESIHQHRMDAERASTPVLDRATTDILVANLAATDPQEILYALGLFRLGQQRAAHPAIRGLLQHPAAEVRQRALEVLAEAGDRTVIPHVEQMIKDPDLGVRTEALLYLTHYSHIDPLDRIQELGDFPDFSIRSAVVAFLARPGETQNLNAARLMFDIMVKEEGPAGARVRLEAARLLPALPDEFDDEIRTLLTDEDPDVVCTAIRAMAKMGKRRFVPRVLDRIADPRFTDDATEAMVVMGPRILGTLRDTLGDPSVPIAVRREIPGILVRLGTPEASRALEGHLFESDTVLRFRVIAALNKLCQAGHEVKLDEQMIETVLAAEIMGHYRSYQILGTLGQDANSEDAMVRALRETLGQEVERIFRLIGLLYPQHDLHSAYFGVQSNDPVVHDNALEFLDNVLKPQLRTMLVPLLDSAVGIGERVRLANRYVGSDVRSREEAVTELISSDDPWLKSCGAYAIGTLGLKSLELHLDGCLSHSDPLLRETARQAKLRLATAPGTSD